MNTALALPDSIFPPSFESDAPSNAIADLFKERQIHINNLVTITGSSGAMASLSDFIASALAHSSELTGARFVLQRLAEDGAAKAILSRIDASLWHRAISMTDILDVMPAARLKQWHEDIESANVPEFTPDALRNTMRDLLAQRRTYFQEKVTGVFDKLSPNHKTNSNWGFRSRMIMEYVYSDCYPSRYFTDIVRDLRSVISAFTGNEQLTDTYRMLMFCRERFVGEWVELDGGSLRLRCYKKGTLHIEVHPEIAYRLNRVLEHARPRALATDAVVRPKTDPKAPTLMRMTIPLPVLQALQDVRWSYQDQGSLQYSMDKAVKRALVEVVNCLGLHVFDGRIMGDKAREIVEQVVMSGYIPERRSHQFYPTPKELAELVCSLANIQAGERVLEPSAGTGSLADVAERIADEPVTCVEISDVFALVLKAKKHSVIHGSFLDKHHGEFDRVVMNPPFTGNQWKTHLEHALLHLASGGVCVCVVPGSFAPEGLTLDQAFHVEVFAQPFKFAHTSVHTKIVRVTRTPQH